MENQRGSWENFFEDAPQREGIKNPEICQLAVPKKYHKEKVKTSLLNITRTQVFRNRKNWEKTNSAELSPLFLIKRETCQKRLKTKKKRREYYRVRTPSTVSPCGKDKEGIVCQKQATNDTQAWVQHHGGVEVAAQAQGNKVLPRPCESRIWRRIPRPTSKTKQK